MAPFPPKKKGQFFEKQVTSEKLAELFEILVKEIEKIHSFRGSNTVFTVVLFNHWFADRIRSYLW